jgi:undecaprenyl diphosphate synthase
MQSTLHQKLHVAIIMDGNGRWAERRGLPRPAGHRAGVEALRRVSEAASGLGVGTLTVYAFSGDNWRRPRSEVTALMALLRHYLASETGRLAGRGIRLTMIGRRDRLPDNLAPLIDRAEAATRDAQALHLRVAFDYSARNAIVEAVSTARPSAVLSREVISRHLNGSSTDVDLMIRTGGEQRLSDFLLWESAYAELFFTPRLWPDFAPADLEAAIADFHRRDRRFGGLGRRALAF